MTSCSDHKTLFHSILSNYCTLNGGSTTDLTNPVTGLSILVTCAVFKSLRRDLQTARQVSKQQGHCTPHRSHRQGPWIGLRCEATPGSVLLSPGWVPLGTGLIRSQVQRLFGPACERDCILPIFQKEKKLRMLRGIASLAQVTQRRQQPSCDSQGEERPQVRSL